MSNLTREQTADLIEDANCELRNALDALNWTEPEDDEWRDWIGRALQNATTAADALAALANASPTAPSDAFEGATE